MYDDETGYQSHGRSIGNDGGYEPDSYRVRSDIAGISSIGASKKK